MQKKPGGRPARAGAGHIGRSAGAVARGPWYAKASLLMTKPARYPEVTSTVLDIPKKKDQDDRLGISTYSRKTTPTGSMMSAGARRRRGDGPHRSAKRAAGGAARTLDAAAAWSAARAAASTKTASSSE